jgi:serine/threonine protein kinase
MKVMRTTSGEIVERFAREVRILKHLVHPALGRYIASGTTAEGHLFVAMEWLPGEDLRLRLQRGSLTVH